MNNNMIDAEELDRLFDEGDMRYLDYFDFTKTTRPGLKQKKMNISLPNWMIASLDEEAHRLGVTRQAIIKLWLNEKLESLST